MADVFRWRVQARPGNSRTYTTRDISYNDGYTQSLGEGINTITQSYTVSCKVNKEDCDAIMAFFDKQAGYKSFFWTDPRGNIGLYRCKDAADMELSNDFFEITGTFEKRYAA